MAQVDYVSEFFFLHLVYMCVCLWDTHVSLWSEDLWELFFLFTLYESCNSNSGCCAWQKVPLPSEPSHWACFFFCCCCFDTGSHVFQAGLELLT